MNTEPVNKGVARDLGVMRDLTADLPESDRPTTGTRSAVAVEMAWLNASI